MTRKSFQKKKVWTWVAVMAVFMAELFFYTWVRVGCTRMGYDITRERNENRKHVKTAHCLKIELARLESPQRIIEKAKQEFGLIIPTSEQIVILP
jgi:cell division protein FtsL